jgi:gamma-aminobutyric acid type B receptor
VVGILGAGCSVSAIEAVKLASRPEVRLVVVHKGGSPMLKNYDNSVGILGSPMSLIDLSLALMKRNGWHNVHVLYDSGHQYYREMKSDFLNELTQNGVTAAVVSPLYSFFYPFNEIRSSRVRIVFILASLEHTKRMLCLAYHMGLVYPAYQWVLLTHTLSDIMASSEYSFTFRYNNQVYKCTSENFVEALEKAFLVSFTLHQGSVMKLLELEVKWNNNTEKAGSDLLYSSYNALYAWVSVLNSLTVAHPNTEFVYANNSLVEMIIEEFFKLSLKGVTGQISFNSSTGFANRPVYLYQIRRGQEINVGSLNSTTIKFLHLSFDHISDQIQKIAQPNGGAIAFVIFVLLVELFVVIFLHIITIVYRKAPSIKATSPKLIHLAFVGGYIFLATHMFLNIGWATDLGPEIDTPICQIIWVWGLPLSFTLIMGIVTVRTWRLYRIFVHYLDPGKFLSNPALTLAVLLLASIDIAIAIIWTAVDPMKFVYKEILLKVGSQYEVFLDPDCTYNLVWFVLVYLFKASLLVALIVLTVLTRKTPIATFTTNNYSLRMFTYAFSVVSVIGFGIYYLLVFTIDHRDPYVEFFTLFSLLNVLFLLFVIFIIAPPIAPTLLKKIKR